MTLLQNHHVNMGQQDRRVWLEEREERQRQRDREKGREYAKNR